MSIWSPMDPPEVQSMEVEITRLKVKVLELEDLVKKARIDGKIEGVEACTRLLVDLSAGDASIIATMRKTVEKLKELRDRK